MTVIQGPRPSTPLGLDVMTRIAEEAGRDAFRKPAADRLESWKSEPRLHQSSAGTPKE